MEPTIERPTGTGLGDCISVLNYLLIQAKQNNQPFKLNIWYPKDNAKRYASVLPLLFPLFDGAGQWCELVDLPFEQADRLKEKLGYSAGYIAENWPLAEAYRWQGSGSKLVAYQFDGRSHSSQKNLTEAEETAVLAAIRQRGYLPVKLGLPLSLKHSAYLMARCRALVTVHSGFAQLAKNMEIPVSFAQKDSPDKRMESHRNYKLASIYKTVDELLKGINTI